MSPHRQLTSDNTNTKIKIKTKLDDFDIKLSKAHIWLVKANLQRGKASTCPDFRIEIPHSYILTQMITQFTFICDFFFIFFSQKHNKANHKATFYDTKTSDKVHRKHHKRKRKY